LVHVGLLTWEAAVRAMTAGPAAALHMAAPALREGAAGEVTLIDPEHEWTVDPGRFYSQGANCPFAGWRLRGKAVTTIVGGRLTVWEGEIVGLGENR